MEDRMLSDEILLALIKKAGGDVSKVEAEVAAIKDGTIIDSFADVETALAGKADMDIVADAFNAAETYAEGDYCTYEGGLYKFKTAHEGAWNAADVDRIKIAGELSELKNTLNHKANLIYDTASGDIASFPDGADGLPVKDLTVGIEPVQSGTGDPSPTNIRPISGWTGCNISHSGADTSDQSVIPISWQSSAGTVYGGTLDVTTGLLTVDRICYSFTGDETINLSGVDTANRRFDTRLDYLGLPDERTGNEEISSHFRQNATNSAPFGNFYIGNPWLVFTDVNAMFSTANAFKSWLAEQKNNGTPVQICYPLATLQTYQLTPTEVSTLLGTNNIWTDCGPSTVEYPADTKLYIDKKLAALS